MQGHSVWHWSQFSLRNNDAMWCDTVSSLLGIINSLNCVLLPLVATWLDYSHHAVKYASIIWCCENSRWNGQLNSGVSSMQKCGGHVGANEKVGGKTWDVFKEHFLTFYYHSVYKFTGVTEHSQNDVHNDLIKLFCSIWPYDKIWRWYIKIKI